MKALVMMAMKGPLEWKDVATPTPGPGEALVRVSHAAYNRRDWWIWQGLYGGLRYPCILGSDVVGMVAEVADATDEHCVGKRVLVNPSLDWGPKQSAQSKDFNILGLPSDGGLAEYVRVPVANLSPAPEHLSDAEAAALPLAGLTAYRALFSRAGLQAGERLLVTGAGGGAALFAIQFGLAAGCEVWVTSGSAEKIERAKKLGAAGGVSYKDAGWAKTLAGQSGGTFDVILDSAGGEGLKDLVELAAIGGRIVFFGGTAGPWPSMPAQRLFWKQVSLLGTTMGSPTDWAAMLAFVNKHRIVPVVDAVYPIEEGQAALERIGAGEQFGKIVLKVKNIE